jgi:hypothetical protein
MPGANEAAVQPPPEQSEAADEPRITLTFEPAEQRHKRKKAASESLRPFVVQ